MATTPNIFIRPAPDALHLGMLVSSSVTELSAMAAAQAVVNTLATKLACVSTFRHVQCLAALTPAYQLGIPALTFSGETDIVWWLSSINMVAVIDGGRADPLVDSVFDTFNNGDYTYPFIHCREDNNYAIEVM